MRILLAPQELKGSLTATDAVEAMAAGVSRVLVRDVQIDRAPIADGGPGFVAAVVAATGGELRRVPCRDPLRREMEAEFGLIDGGKTAIIEMAAAAGLVLLRPEERNPLVTGTEGVGDLIRAALDAGATRLIVGLGGSATNDGGAGMAMALGATMRAFHNRLPPGGGQLSTLDWVSVDGLDSRLHSVQVIGATDVRNPLCGPEGASAVFGPQKGASPSDVSKLDAGLRHYAFIIKRDLGVDVLNVAGSGAAGGLGAGLIAFLGAELRSGFELVAELTRLEQRIAQADLVVTGEGRLDWQSVYGKTTIGVGRLAKRHDVPVIAVCGGLGDGWRAALDEGITAAWSIVSGPMPLEEASARAAELLASATEQAVRLFMAGRSAGASGESL